MLRDDQILNLAPNELEGAIEAYRGQLATLDQLDAKHGDAGKARRDEWRRKFDRKLWLAQSQLTAIRLEAADAA